MLKTVVVLFAVLAVALAALAIYPLEPKPEKFKNVPGCYIKELDDVIAVGSSKPSVKECMEYRCMENQVTRVSCGAVDVKEPCKKVTNVDLPYPDCCPTFTCPHK